MNTGRERASREIIESLQALGRYLAHHGLPEGVSVSQYIVLKELNQGRLRPSDLAGCLGVTPGTVTPLIDRLTQGGLVDRSRDPDDRRMLRLALTGAGRRRLAEIEQCHQAVLQRLTAGLSDEELLGLRHGLARMQRTAVMEGE